MVNGDAKRQCVRDNFSFPTNVLEAVIDSSSTEQLSNSGTLSYRPRKRNLDSRLSDNVDESINVRRGPYVFKISGQLYHWLGSLIPHDGDPPSDIRRDIIEGLFELLDNHNALVQLFKTTHEKLLDSDIPPFKVKLYSVVGACEYELPTCDMLGAIVYEPGPEAEMDYDIIIEERDGQPQRLVNVPGTSSDGDRRLTMKAYYTYMIHDRVNSFNYLSRTGDTDGSDRGGRLILPQSFTGGPRDMYAHYLDALAICHDHELTTSDRADIVDRVFEMKIHQFVKFLCDVRPFGKIVADERSRIQNHEDIDTYVSAELPSMESDPKCHIIVSEFMVPGPANWSVQVTHDGFVHYRRRDTGITTTKQNIELDNRYIVPYNRQLSTTFYAHINAEYCGWTMLIKYLFKYISKGTDRIDARLSRNQGRSSSSIEQQNVPINEIKNYLDSRYISPHEACWRLFEFDIHSRELAVQILQVHLQNMQRVFFRDRDQLQAVVDNPHKKKTTLTVGRQFLWKTIIYALRSEGRIVLAVASSGIASSLLPSSRTAHSRFKLPLDLNDSSVCSVKKNTQLAKLTLKDILDTPTKLFGVKTVMLGGDFRQTFPVKKSAPRHEIITSSIVSSYLWRSFRLFILTENMRLKQGSLSEAEKRKVSVFAEWLLNVGDGVLGTPDEHDPENTSWVEIPDIYRILDDENGVTNLIRFIYDNHTLLYPTAKDLQEKAIVCPRNDTVDTINATIMNTLPGTLTKYISYDEALPHGHDRGEIELLYPELSMTIVHNKVIVVPKGNRFEELGWISSKVERRRTLGLPSQSHASPKTATPMLQENKETTSATSKRIIVESTTKVDVISNCLRSPRWKSKVRFTAILEVGEFRAMAGIVAYAVFFVDCWYKLRHGQLTDTTSFLNVNNQTRIKKEREIVFHWQLYLKSIDNTTSVSDSRQQPPYTKSKHKENGTIRSARHMERRLYQKSRYPNAKTMALKQLLPGDAQRWLGNHLHNLRQ
ncbi:DNA helicase [Tanacetum coccineum]